MQQLSKRNLSEPALALLALPEKVIQFGTGVLLRGLPDYLIDQANRQGYFNGRVVVVKTTAMGDARAFEKQDNLYTVCIRGIENGHPVSENIISTAISRVLSARQQWPEVLACAANPLLEIVISNTTEVGIQPVQENVQQPEPPDSFPGKLLALLLARYHAFRGDSTKGLVIVPTELITRNGDVLRSIVLELAHWNNLEVEIIEWIENNCTFCNSLVDRIVPGQPAATQMAALQAALGYSDGLLLVAEPYHLWAIEGDEKAAAVLSFQLAAPKAVVVVPDIDRFRERKLRLLNGTHTLACGLAHLAGFTTVSTAMEDPAMSAFIEYLLLREIAPAIPYVLPPGDADQFGRQVLERFRNPFVEHRWLNITVQYSAKMRLRTIPVLLEHYRKSNHVPVCFALGFAAFLCFYRQHTHPIQDDRAAYFIEKWQTHTPEDLVWEVVADTNLWGHDLSQLPGFAAQVQRFVTDILEQGSHPVIHILKTML